MIIHFAILLPMINLQGETNIDFIHPGVGPIEEGMVKQLHSSKELPSSQMMDPFQTTRRCTTTTTSGFPICSLFRLTSSSKMRFSSWTSSSPASYMYSLSFSFKLTLHSWRQSVSTFRTGSGSSWKAGDCRTLSKDSTRCSNVQRWWIWLESLQNPETSSTLAIGIFPASLSWESFFEIAGSWGATWGRRAATKRGESTLVSWGWWRYDESSLNYHSLHHVVACQ